MTYKKEMPFKKALPLDFETHYYDYDYCYNFITHQTLQTQFLHEKSLTNR